MKRFYKKVTVERQDEMFAVLLDGKQIKTPEKELCIMPSRQMADVVRAEWHNQGGDIVPATMPITKLANTAIDRVQKRRDEIIDELVKYAGSDQLCYRAEHPSELVRLQNKIWDRLLCWMKDENDIGLKTSKGIIFVEQDESELAKFRNILNDIGSFELTALYSMVAVTGSTTIGYALFKNHISVEQAWEAGHLDENFQVSQWGTDEEAEERRKNLKNELNNAAVFLALCQSN